MADLKERSQKLFAAMVDAYDGTSVWEGSRAQGLFDAYVIMNEVEGDDLDELMEHLHEAVNEDRQRRHDEMLASLESGTW